MGNSSARAKAGSHAEWREMLRTTTVKDVKAVRMQRLITVEADADVKTALTALSTNKLISAVVKDHSSFVDFIHLGELAAELAYFHKTRVIPEMEKQRHPDAAAETLNTEAFFHLPLRDVIKHQHQKFIRASPDDTLVSIANRMHEQKVYRVAVCDPGTKAVVDVLTQTDILQWIYAHSTQEWFAKHASAPVSSVAGEKALVKVNQSTITVDCFSMLRKHGFSSLPVVLDDGRLYSVVSATVLRGLGPNEAIDLLKPIGKFLTDRKEPVGGALITGTPEMSLLHALELMGKHRLHRLYIVNKYHVPVGVLSLTDVIHWLVATEDKHGAEKKEEAKP